MLAWCTGLLAAVWGVFVVGVCCVQEVCLGQRFVCLRFGDEFVDMMLGFGLIYRLLVIGMIDVLLGGFVGCDC